METMVTEQKDLFYLTEKKYVRNVEVYYLGKTDKIDHFQVLVVEFDFSDDDNAEGILIKEISYLFDELEIFVDEEGNILKIGNLDFLKRRWIIISGKLSLSHKGETIDNYLAQISELLENEQELIDFLSGYKMFGLLFNGLLNSFQNKTSRVSSEGLTEILKVKIESDTTMISISADNIEDTGIKDFSGILQYRNDRYEEGFIQVKKHNYHLKHSLLWIG
ncbi:hypothetical protein MKJ01_13840 [Chryseobacterium sp. SSA4.19]|uniref:hypothetical protein n=1 Tax=Chryseobacterium sp. SSA4.19 TaxID=2919915 RepID=UPI001F4E02D9|nr:hypothetical protein [Chryseobacterium sp. SSA4.19]MCJ8154849.1 hypothetical protein [Chryseobacterium sp. SSA4.19]